MNVSREFLDILCVLAHSPQADAKQGPEADQAAAANSDANSLESRRGQDPEHRKEREDECA